MEAYSNIYLDEDQMISKIEELIKEKINMERIFQTITNDNLGMINYWSGTKGNEAYETVKQYTKRFSQIINEIDSYIKFLENTVVAYDTMDKVITNRVEENINISAY